MESDNFSVRTVETDLSGFDFNRKTLAVPADENLNLAKSIHDLLRGEHVSIRALPRNLERTTTKRGFRFNILVAGRYDLGQEDLIQTLFGVNMPEQEITELCIREDNIRVSDGPVKLHLNVLTTPLFGMRLNETNSYRTIVDDVQERMLKFLHEESQLYRKKSTPDERIHLCLYLLPPAGLPLPPNDAELISRLTAICNVIPVIARADHLTPKETVIRKEMVSEAISELRTFELPEGDKEIDEDEWIDHLRKIKSRVPFACMLDNKNDERFPDYDANCDSYTDTNILRAAIIAHMCDLVDSTHYKHYEHFRAKVLMEKHHVRSSRQEHFTKHDEIEDVDNAYENIRTSRDLGYNQTRYF